MGLPSPCHCFCCQLLCMTTRRLIYSYGLKIYGFYTPYMAEDSSLTFLRSKRLMDTKTGPACMKLASCCGTRCCQFSWVACSIASDGSWTAGYRTSGTMLRACSLVKVCANIPAAPTQHILGCCQRPGLVAAQAACVRFQVHRHFACSRKAEHMCSLGWVGQHEAHPLQLR